MSDSGNQMNTDTGPEPDEAWMAAGNRVIDAQDGPPSVMADLAYLLAKELGAARLTELVDEAYRMAQTDPNSRAMNEALARGEDWSPASGFH